MKETKIGRNRYRFVKCTKCGKVFNACSRDGNIEGVMYKCPEFNCHGKLVQSEDHDERVAELQAEWDKKYKTE